MDFRREGEVGEGSNGELVRTIVLGTKPSHRGSALAFRVLKQTDSNTGCVVGAKYGRKLGAYFLIRPARNALPGPAGMASRDLQIWRAGNEPRKHRQSKRNVRLWCFFVGEAPCSFSVHAELTVPFIRVAQTSRREPFIQLCLHAIARYAVQNVMTAKVYSRHALTLSLPSC